MRDILKKIGNFYFLLKNKGEQTLEKVIHKDVEKAKKNYFKQHHVNPSVQEIIDFKMEILMKKAIILFLVIFILYIIFL